MTSERSYEERYCLFLDILGFQSHIDESVSLRGGSKNAMTFPKLRSVLSRISGGVNYKESIVANGKTQPSSRRVTQFSDSVVISYLKNELNGAGVASILHDVHRLQLDLVHSGVLMRGAVSSGLLFHDSSFVFGPALNEAVALEKLANYPRVIMDGQVFDDAGFSPIKKLPKSRSWERTISSMMTKDFDGLYYVDYFNSHPDDFNENWDEFYQYLESLRSVVKGLANKKSPSIKVKHSWLRTKFNDMLEPLEKSGFREIAGVSVPEDFIEQFRQLKTF